MKTLGISKNRSAHCLEVAKLMYEAAFEDTHNLEYSNEMFLLGYLHDIGYQFCENQKDHNHVGGELLKKENYKYWKEVYYHGEPQTEYCSKELTWLNICDLQVSNKGVRVSVEERLNDICLRYGENSSQYLDAVKLAKIVGLK